MLMNQYAMNSMRPTTNRVTEVDVVGVMVGTIPGHPVFSLQGVGVTVGVAVFGGGVSVGGGVSIVEVGVDVTIASTTDIGWSKTKKLTIEMLKTKSSVASLILCM